MRLIHAVCARVRERFAPRRVEPLRVRVWFRSEAAWQNAHPLRIEGLMQDVAISRVCNVSSDELFRGWRTTEPAELAIPIADVEMHGRLIACASQPLLPDCSIEGGRTIRRRPNCEEYGLRKVMTNGGEYKATQRCATAIVTPYLDFFVRGDRHVIADLARDFVFLGANGPRGMGHLCGVEIDDDPDDRSLVFQGRPQRTLPVSDEHEAALLYEHGSYDLRFDNTRAPYWHRHTRCLCAAPAGD